MSKNANLKWQDCIDAGYRRDFRNTPADATQRGEARSADADDRKNDESDDIAVAKPEGPGHP